MIQSRVPWGTRGIPDRWAEYRASLQGKPDTNPIEQYMGYGILRSRDDGATWKFEKVDIDTPTSGANTTRNPRMA